MSDMQVKIQKLNQATSKWENTIWKVLAQDTRYGVLGIIENKKTHEKWDWEDHTYGPIIHNMGKKIPKYIHEKILPELIRACNRI